MYNRPNGITLLEKIKKTSGVIIPKDNLELSVLYVLGSSLARVTTDEKLIT